MSSKIEVSVGITDQQKRDLLRFHETTEDDQGYDVPKDRMKSLARLGLIRSLGFSRYEFTDTGSAMVEAIAAPVVERLPVCDHEWADDGLFSLVCTKCGAQENHDPLWRDMATAPKDGTLVRLLVEFEDHSTEDETEAPTIGANNFDNDEQDEWLFAGWCWTHDHWTQGKGTPIGWLPMIDTAPPELAELQATIARLTAENERLRAGVDGDMAEIDRIQGEYDKQFRKVRELKAEIERLKGGQGEPVASKYNDDDAQTAFEALNPMPAHITKFKGGYAPTEFNAWSAQDFCKKWDGFKQCAKLYTSQPAPVAVLDPCDWSDGQILDFLGVALRNVDLSGEVKLSEIRQGFEYVRQNACLDKVKELNQ